MAAVQIWWHQGLVADDAGLGPILKEPWLDYTSATVTTVQNFPIPTSARYAVIETAAAIAYRVRPSANAPAAATADCPQIAATANDRYVIDVSRGGNLGIIEV